MTRMIYTNAPLVEVIAEVRWKTIPLVAIPDGGIDPHFDVLLNEFRTKARENSYIFEEPLTPPEIPRELLPGKVMYRFRTTQNRWPLYQIGPGVFTVNIVPPYQGWSYFAPIIEQGISWLLSSYPSSSTVMTLDLLMLRYVNAFTAAHGRRNSRSFLLDGLGHQVIPPETLLKKD